VSAFPRSLPWLASWLASAGVAGRFGIEYNQGYTFAVKTAISIPNETFEAAEKLAKRIGISRSELYATAVAEYLARHRAAGVRERLDAVYDIEHEAAQLDAVMKLAQPDSDPGDDW
jgi:hypothetical protein